MHFFAGLIINLIILKLTVASPVPGEDLPETAGENRHLEIKGSLWRGYGVYG